MKPTDFELGVELASGIYKDVIREYSAENTKLWELAHLVAEYTSANQCEGCVTKSACNAGELDMCWIRKAILEKLHELGVE